MVTGCVSVGKLGESEVFRVNQTSFIPLKGPQTLEEERVSELRKLLSGGTFYFYWSAVGEPNDITLCAQKLQKNPGTDNRFFWNRFSLYFMFHRILFHVKNFYRLLHMPLLHYGINCSQWLFRITCGSVEIRTVYAGHRQFKVIN